MIAPLTMTKVLNQIFFKKIIAKIGYPSMLDYYLVVCEKLFLQQPISYIVDFNSFIAIFWMPGSGNNHFRVSISDLK